MQIVEIHIFYKARKIAQFSGNNQNTHFLTVLSVHSCVTFVKMGKKKVE